MGGRQQRQFFKSERKTYGTYIYANSLLYDITPLRQTNSSVSNIFTTANGTNVVTVNITGHNANEGDIVNFSGTTGLSGTSFSASDFDNNFEIQSVEKTIDADGNTETMDWPVLSEDDLVETRTATYNIPEADRTTLAHGETHPHNHENEIAFQEKYMKWWNDWEASL